VHGIPSRLEELFRAVSDARNEALLGLACAIFPEKMRQKSPCVACALYPLLGTWVACDT
jgi:hypothetical protein